MQEKSFDELLMECLVKDLKTLTKEQRSQVFSQFVESDDKDIVIDITREDNNEQL